MPPFVHSPHLGLVTGKTRPSEQRLHVVFTFSRGTGGHAQILGRLRVTHLLCDFKTQCCLVAKIASGFHEASSVVVFSFFDLGEQTVAQLPHCLPLSCNRGLYASGGGAGWPAP